MIRKSRFEITKFVCRLLSDSAATLLAWFLAYWLRFFVLPGAGWNPASLFVLLSLVAWLATLLFQSANHLYHHDVSRTWLKEASQIFVTTCGVFLFFVTFYYFFFPSKISRVALALFAVFHFLFLVLGRTLVNAAFARQFKKGRLIRNVLLVGRGEKLRQYAEAATASRDLGLRISGQYKGAEDPIEGVPQIEARSLEEAADKAQAELVAISFPGPAFSLEEKLLAEGNELTAQNVFLVPNLPKSYAGTCIADFHTIPIVKINENKAVPLAMAAKRLFDLSVCLLAVALLSPLLLAIAVLVKATSKGPVLFRQKRVTRDGRVFTMYKFRSMRTDMAEGDPHWTEENDPRITRIGRFLRRTSLDELPQFFNVIGGSMSLIGPRPERPELEDKFRKEIPGYLMRHRMKAGISGWAQVNGLRGNTSLYKRIDFDLYYIRNWNIGFDMKIVLLTFFKGFVNKNAY